MPHVSHLILDWYVVKPRMWYKLFLEILWATSIFIIAYLIQVGAQGGLEGPYQGPISREFITEFLASWLQICSNDLKKRQEVTLFTYIYSYLCYHCRMVTAFMLSQVNHPRVSWPGIRISQVLPYVSSSNLRLVWCKAL